MLQKRVERRRAASAHRPTRQRTAGFDPGAVAQPLESRTMFAVGLTFDGLFNASKQPANQSESAITFNRTNPNALFMSSNHGAFREPDQGPNDPILEEGIFTSYSLDGGTTWVPRLMADGTPATAAAARLVGDINVTDASDGGGSAADVTMGALAADASGATYAINMGPGGRVQVVLLSFPTTPVGATGQVTGTVVAEINSQTAAASGGAFGGSVANVAGADFNPIDGRLYFVASGGSNGTDMLFSVDVNPALTRGQREASVQLVGSFGTPTNNTPSPVTSPSITSIAFDVVPAGVQLVGVIAAFATPTPADAANNRLFRVNLDALDLGAPTATIVPVVNEFFGQVNGAAGGIEVFRDTPDGPNDVILLAGDDMDTNGLLDTRAFRVEPDGNAIPLGPLNAAATGTAPSGLTYNPALVDPFTQRQGAFVAVDGASDELFFVDVRDREFPVACCDPATAYDDFGNLYFVYLSIDPVIARSAIVVLLSTDGGANFEQIGEILAEQPNEPAGVDRCEVATATLPDGTAVLWVSYVDFSSSAFTMSAVGTSITGLGTVGTTYRGLQGAFNDPQKLPQGGPGTGSSLPHNVGHVAIGPDGQVSVAHQDTGRTAADKIYVNTDPDGLGPAPFGNAVLIDATQVLPFEPIPGQPVRGLSAVATVAYDRSNGPNRGRLYISYTQEVTEDRVGEEVGSDGLPITVTQSTDMNVNLRFSDDFGASWSPAFIVNDDPITDQNAQFFQRVAVDQTTGNVAVTWLDSRDDVGGGDSDDEIGCYATVGQSMGNGIVFAPNLRLNVGLSNARFSGNLGNDYGDYIGLDYHDNVFWVAYPDNSNSLGDNPSGRLRAFDIYAARVRVTDTTVAEPPFVTPASPLAPTVQKPLSLVRKGKFYQLRMSYSHPSGVNLATVGNDDILVTGPNGFSQTMTLVRAKAQTRLNRVTATYRLAAPGGTWDAADNGVYTATLQAGAVTAGDNATTTTAGTITRFAVNAKAARVRGAGRAAPVAAGILPVAQQQASPFSDASVLGEVDDEQSLRLLA
jgi:hypothetical protein